MTELRLGDRNAWPGPWSLEPLSWSNEGKLGQDGEYIMRTCVDMSGDIGEKKILN